MIVCEKLHPLSIFRLIFLICADLSAVFYFHSYFTLVLLICLILAPTASLCITRHMLKNTDLSVRAGNRQVLRDNPCEFTIEIRNPSIFPLLILNIFFDFENIFLNTSGEISRKRCSPGRFFRFMLPAPTNICGLVNLNLISMTASDFFGIADFKKTISMTASCTIFPVAENLSAQEQMFASAVCQSCTSQTSGSDEYSHIREYQPGDPLNRIHWKLSARVSSLMLKQYLQENGSSPHIYLELSASGPEIINHLLDRAYSLALYCLELEYSPILCLPDNFPEDLQNYVIADEAGLNQCFNELLGIPLPETAYFEQETFTEHDILIHQDGNYETFNTFYNEIEN